MIVSGAVTREEVYQRLRDLCAGRTQRVVAAELGISPGKLNDWLHPTAAERPQPALLRALGLREVVLYEPVTSASSTSVSCQS